MGAILGETCTGRVRENVEEDSNRLKGLLVASFFHIVVLLHSCVAWLLLSFSFLSLFSLGLGGGGGLLWCEKVKVGVRKEAMRLRLSE